MSNEPVPSEIVVSFSAPAADILESPKAEPLPESKDSETAKTVLMDPPELSQKASIIEPQNEKVYIASVDTAAVVDSSALDSLKQFDAQQFYLHAFTMDAAMQEPDAGVDSLDSSVNSTSGLAPIFSFDNRSPGSQPGPYDHIQKGIDIYNRDGGQTMPLGQALTQGASLLSKLFNKKNDKPVRFDAIPTKAEIEVFTVLWDSSKAEDRDIYAAMDSSIRITASDLNKVLTAMTEKGILERTIVSPQREFTFPLGKVEMSAKNRRNRIYEYTTTVKPHEVLNFLQAKLYEYENAPNMGGKNREKFLVGLREKVFKVATKAAEH